MTDLYGSRELSEREKVVTDLVAQGFKNKEIAATLGTTENMVKHYLTAIFDKLGFSNRVELAVWHESRKVTS